MSTYFLFNLISSFLSAKAWFSGVKGLFVWHAIDVMEFLK